MSKNHLPKQFRNTKSGKISQDATVNVSQGVYLGDRPWGTRCLSTIPAIAFLLLFHYNIQIVVCAEKYLQIFAQKSQVATPANA